MLAGVVLLAAWRGPSTEVRVVVLLDLLILVMGAPSHWIAAFPAGMGIADAFGVSGADYAPWGTVFYGVSAVALVALVVGLVVVGLTTRGRRSVNAR